MMSSLLPIAILLSTAMQEVPPEVRTRPPEAQVDTTELYLQNKAKEFERSSQAVTARNSAPNYQAILTLLQRKRPFAESNVIGKDEVQRNRVRDALVRTVAYHLTMLGLTPSQITRYQNAGLDPLAAGARLIGGTPTLEDILTISPTVAVVRVAENHSGSDDEFDRRLNFTVVEPLKGKAPNAIDLETRAPAPLSSVDVGEEYLVFLSAELKAAQRAAGRASDNAPAFVATPFEIIGSSITPISPSIEPYGGTIEDVRAFLNRHADEFRTSGSN